MPDIFISYRHGDTDKWVAGRLFDRLKHPFDVFFDGHRESIDYGSSFPDEIEEAIAECRVVLALIGPDWLDPTNLARLKEDDDWVRRELRTALNQRHTLVVPLLVESETPPEASLLPADLEPLTKRLCYRLDPERWEKDPDLERRLRDWLSKRAATLEPRASLPPALPFLCDRRDQEDAFVDLVRNAESSSGFIACVVHGHKWESHDELLDRFRNEGVVDDVFHSKEEGTAFRQMQLNTTKLKAGRFAEWLRNAIKSDVLHRRSIPDSELAASLRRLAQPLVAILQLTWSDCQDLGTDAVKNLVEAWLGLGTVGADGTVERLPHPALLWINVTYDETDYELPGDVLHSPLPKLRAVEERHIREWVGLDRVKPYVAAKKRELLNVPSDARYYHTPGKVHMMRFADAVRDIILLSN